MLGVHASAQAIIHFGKIARKHNLTGVCLDSLSRIHTIPSVPIVDCFQKIRQQVKCYLQMSGAMGKTELNEGLEVIESTNLKYFTKEFTAEFYALKGMFLAQVGRSDDANKAFSAAVQMHDTLVKAWALWGDYLETVFTREKQMNLGVSAITCFLHACRHQNESKSRKYLAKVLWLLTYDDEKTTLAEAVDKYCVGVPPIQWLPCDIVEKTGVGFSPAFSRRLMNAPRAHPQRLSDPQIEERSLCDCTPPLRDFKFHQHQSAWNSKPSFRELENSDISSSI
ncbi:transformation/transcription domain-associated protein-like [Pecten maximus]|uniref:transformation/transcription domain-associated protein-like n=1 Tax=Pecten maximus TaxID=6579 RepID=UPI0014582977|nr:transformation/transcription domain-associated protein-like [Pecten maximus]